MNTVIEAQQKFYEDCDMVVHKVGASTEEYLAETVAWESEMSQIVKEPAFTMPKGLSREQRKEWIKKCANGEIEADA